MEETPTVNMNLLKAAKIATIVLLLLILSQAMTGIGRFTSTMDSSALDASHLHTARLGLVIAILVAVAIVMSKTEDKKLKAFGFESATFWLVMYGIGEMTPSNGNLAMIHVPIAMIMFARLMMMSKAFPSEDAN